MKIKSNKRLLARIRNHEVGVRYPDLIPYIACNIVTQRDNSIFKLGCYRRFSNWFYWEITREGHDYWRWINKTLQPVIDEIDKTLYTVNNEDD